MKDYPQNVKQWSQEAYDCLIPAWDQLMMNNPFLSEKQKERLIDIAVDMACANRDIVDPKFKAHALEYAKEVFLGDYNSRNIDDKINFSLCFVLAYFDAHLSLSMIKQEMANEAISILKHDFDLSYEGKQQSNVFTINYSGKA